jgi:hypothetical protein
MTKTAHNGKPEDISGHDTGMHADASDPRLEELYQWMDEAEAEFGAQDPRVVRHNELFDFAITGLADLVRVSPHDEIERMVAAQLVATHAATMDCYRRSRTVNLEHRSENLRHAKQLTRAFAMLLGAFQRNRKNADARGEMRPPSDVEIPPRVPPRRARAARAPAARWNFTEQPHAKAAPRKPAAAAQPAAEPPGTVNVVIDGPHPRVERVPVEQAEAMAASAKAAKQPHAKGARAPGAEQPHAKAPGVAGAESARQPHAKAAGAPGAAPIPPAEVNDRPWADPTRWGKDPRAGAGPRRNRMGGWRKT